MKENQSVNTKNNNRNDVKQINKFKKAPIDINKSLEKKREELEEKQGINTKRKNNNENNENNYHPIIKRLKQETQKNDKNNFLEFELFESFEYLPVEQINKKKL